MRLKVTPVSAIGSPTRETASQVAGRGIPMITMRRRTSTPTPRTHTAARVAIVAIAAPTTPSSGAGPSPRMSTGSRISVTATELASRRNGVRVSPLARKAASTVKKPNSSGAARRSEPRDVRRRLHEGEHVVDEELPDDGDKQTEDDGVAQRIPHRARRLPMAPL